MLPYAISRSSDRSAPLTGPSPTLMGKASAEESGPWRTGPARQRFDGSYRGTRPRAIDPKPPPVALQSGHRNRVKPPLKLRQRATLPSQIGCPKKDRWQASRPPRWTRTLRRSVERLRTPQLPAGQFRTPAATRTERTSPNAMMRLPDSHYRWATVSGRDAASHSFMHVWRSET